MRLSPLAILLALAACAPPDLDVEGTEAAERAAAPRLLPLAEVLAPPPEPPEDPDAFSEALDARVAALRDRAAALPDPDPDAPAAVDARLRSLRGRAEALRARDDATATPEERERLDRLRQRLQQDP